MCFVQNICISFFLLRILIANHDVLLFFCVLTFFCWISFYFNRFVNENHLKRCGLYEQRSYQSEFSFELQNLSAKFASHDQSKPKSNTSITEVRIPILLEMFATIWVIMADLGLFCSKKLLLRLNNNCY